MTEKLTKLALTSRIIVLILQLLANSSLPDHKTDVFHAANELNLNKTTTTTTTTETSDIEYSWLDKTIDICLGGLRHWDGEYFLHIAEYSYSYENTLAFYPLYPLLVGVGARALHALSLGLNLSSCMLLVAVTLNVYIFCKAANVLYDLTLSVFGNAHKSWYAAMLFCFNPASIFFSAVYTETLFAWLTFNLMLECVNERRSLRLIFWLMLSIMTRSNGLTNIGFILYFMLRELWLKRAQTCITICKLLLITSCSLLPLSIFYHHAFKLYCLTDTDIKHSAAIIDYAKTRNYVLAGARIPGNSAWCDATIPNPYAYIQSHYWHVGFLRYYEWKQLPNFILAMPILGVLLQQSYNYMKQIYYANGNFIKEYKSLPFVLHALFLSIFCIFFVHIQVSTRLLCAASPCIFWFGADLFNIPLNQIKFRSKVGMLLLWFVSYALIGTILFSNNLPWT